MQIADQDLLIPEIELTIEFDYGGELQGNAGGNSYFIQQLQCDGRGLRCWTLKHNRETL